MSHVLPWLESVKPDVLCIQETTTVDEKFPRAAFEDGWTAPCAQFVHSQWTVNVLGKVSI